MKDKEIKDWGVKKSEATQAQYTISCLICGETIDVYEYSVIKVQVCKDCKKAIAYAKELMKKERL